MEISGWSRLVPVAGNDETVVDPMCMSYWSNCGVCCIVCYCSSYPHCHGAPRTVMIMYILIGKIKCTWPIVVQLQDTVQNYKQF